MIRIAWWLLTGFWIGSHEDEVEEKRDEVHKHDWSVWSFPAIAEWVPDSSQKNSERTNVACQSRACIQCGEVEIRWVRAWSPELGVQLKKLSPSLTEDGQCSSQSTG